jgi:predicted GNAT superfamily acetyltransferase
MTENLPQSVSDSIVPKVLALNNAHSVELSGLDVNRLKSLLRQAFYGRMIGSADAFLIAFDQGASYDSPNYMWFRKRYTRFVYVNRVVVSPSMRGRGYARLLYTDLFEQARRAAHHVVVCEVNSDPPNPASDAFHAAFEFKEVGQVTIHGGSKTVRYLARAV